MHLLRLCLRSLTILILSLISSRCFIYLLVLAKHWINEIPKLPNRFIKSVPFLNLFIETGFCLGNRFKEIKKISIKDPKLKLNLKYFWENCFFKITGSKMEPIPINRFKNGISLKNRFEN